MNIKTHRTIVAIGCFLFFASLVLAQEKAKKPPIVLTESKLLISQLPLNEKTSIEITGKAGFRITAYNSDDSLAGILTFTISADSKQRIAQAMNKREEDISNTIVQDGIVANFAKETECPTIHLVFPGMELALSGKKLRFDRFVLDLKETDEPISQILCIAARRISRGYNLGGRGPARRINEILNGEEDKEQ